MQCIEAKHGEIVINRSYQDEMVINMYKSGEPMSLRN